MGDEVGLGVCVLGVQRQTVPVPSPPPPPPHTPSPFSPSLISLMVSVDVKHHVYLLTWLESGRILSVFCIILFTATENKCIRAVYFCCRGRFLDPSGHPGRILCGGYLVPSRMTKTSPPLSSPTNLPFVCIHIQCSMLNFNFPRFLCHTH